MSLERIQISNLSRDLRENRGEYSEKRHVNIVHNFELVAVDVIYFVLKTLVHFQSEVDM